MSRLLPLCCAILIGGSVFSHEYRGPLSAPQTPSSWKSAEPAPLPPCIVWQPLSYDFGRVDLGTQATTTVVLQNTSPSAHEITEIEIEPIEGNPGAFSLSGREPPFVMFPGERQYYTLSYRPAAKGVDIVRVHAYNTGYSPSDASSSWDAVMSAQGEGVIPLLLPKR